MLKSLKYYLLQYGFMFLVLLLFYQVYFESHFKLDESQPLTTDDIKKINNQLNQKHEDMKSLYLYVPLFYFIVIAIDLYSLYTSKSTKVIKHELQTTN